MVFNTATVGTAVTPAVIQTFINHYLNRKPLAQKPTAHISYDEGLHLIQKFLIYASHHTVEDVQRFTSQWVPHPRWVKVDTIPIPQEHISKAAEAIQEQLGRHGIDKVGGKTWWQWRRPGGELKAEWIEMRADANERKLKGGECKRVMLYVHGGGYFFGSTDEHRYQMQRHARKLKARVFARMLVILRDRGIPLPAGAILISPWCDLTHSFPSVAGDNPLDYIPPHGFHQRPSPAWPPPNSDDMMAIEEGLVKNLAHKDHKNLSREQEADAIQGFHVNKDPAPGTQNETADSGTATNDGSGPAANTVPGAGHDLSIMIDGKLVEIKDQIQMYATNQLISHPLVSPILQPSLGGLPPLLILTGGGEMLRDEQIYLAHKAANPTKYPPGDAFLDDNPHGHNRDQVNRWKPTDVQLQVWDDLCHVAPTLSFTRPAKYMYRSIAQFGAWALARAQKSAIEILDDDDVSIISRSSSDDEGEPSKQKEQSTPSGPSQVGKAGDPLPPFKHHMIRQRVDRHGNVRPLEPELELAGCSLPPSEIGIIKEGPVKKWMAAKREWDTKYASAKRRVQKQRAKEMAKGYKQFGDGEVPPPSALAGRRGLGQDLKEEKKKRSKGMSMWALWGSKHDEKTIELEEQADRAGEEPETSVATSTDGAGARPLDDTKTAHGKRLDSKKPDWSRSRSRRRIITDENQTDEIDENTPAAVINSKLAEKRPAEFSNGNLTPDFVASDPVPQVLVHSPTIVEDDSKRPTAGGVAYPFSLANHAATASMTTLTSAVGVPPAQDLKIASIANGDLKQNDTAVEAAAGDSIGASALESSGLVQGTTVPMSEKDDHNNKTSEINGKAGDSIGASALEHGGVVKDERPVLETFVSAVEDLPGVGPSAGK